MTSRLDEIFVPGKLRQNWQTQALPAADSAQLTLNLEIVNKYRELLRLIEQKFPDDASRLSVNLAELSQLFEQTYPQDADAQPVSDKAKQTLVDKLEQLEELLWALSLIAQNPE